jgi:hypothetical protein
MICQHYSIGQIDEAFGARFLDDLITYRDAGIGPDDFPISVKDCLRGL